MMNRAELRWWLLLPVKIVTIGPLLVTELLLVYIQDYAHRGTFVCEDLIKWLQKVLV